MRQVFLRSKGEAVLRAGVATAWLLAALVALSGCERPYPCCLKRDEQARVSCILECARAANPMSDEEGEDLVSQCDRSCTEPACSQWTVIEAVDAYSGRDASCIRAGGVP